jgi:hypothetical protein
VIEKFQREQTVSTEKIEPVQNVPIQSEQNVSAEPEQWAQNVSTKWKQNVGTLYRDNNTENKETEKTDRENQTIWTKAIEQLKADLTREEVAARLNGSTLLQVTDTVARIGVPNAFAIAWLERRMYGQIAKAMKGVLGRDLDLQFIAAS